MFFIISDQLCVSKMGEEHLGTSESNHSTFEQCCQICLKSKIIKTMKYFITELLYKGISLQKLFYFTVDFTI